MPRNLAASPEIESAPLEIPAPPGLPVLEDDWSFAHLERTETLWGPHGYHRYPAKFIPQLVRRIIEDYSEPGDLVGDTFLGSGTTGVEALRCGREFWGADINPVATLISRAKCTPLKPSRLRRAWEGLLDQLSRLPRIGRRLLSKGERETVEAVDIAQASSEERFNYWFPTAHVAILEQILNLILVMRGESTRTFFLCAFSNILKNCSIWLCGSTKPQKDLGKTLSDPVNAFCRQARDMLRRNEAYWDDLAENYEDPGEVVERCTLRVRDARCLPLVDGELDLLVTSPPYATCYQYLELHQLTQLWFERYGLLPSVKLRQNCIGGKRPSDRSMVEPVVSTGSASADQALLRLGNRETKSTRSTVRREVRALRGYFLDMKEVITESARVVRPEGYFVLVVGDSRKRGVTIPTSTAFCEMAETEGFKLERRQQRRIPGRVLVATRDQTTGRFSSTEESDTHAYPEEDVLVFKRRADL